MGFKTGKRIGKHWEDAIHLDRIIQDFPFHTTGKGEHDFENGFASVLMDRAREFNSKVFSQIDKNTTVHSIFCFGKKHRPDITLDIDGVAVELKFVNYEGLKETIGQCFLYRLKYKFVFSVLIISEKRKQVYLDIDKGEEKDLEDILSYLANSMNIFTYIVPAFNLKPGVRKCVSFF